MALGLPAECLLDAKQPGSRTNPDLHLNVNHHQVEERESLMWSRAGE